MSDTLGALVDVAAATLVVIHDGWSGLSDDSPIEVVYELRRQESGALAGTARSFRRCELEDEVDITLGVTIARRFLSTLAAARVAPDAYAPFIDHTDDFPRIEVAIHVAPPTRRNGIALLFSSSQGELYAPWCGTMCGEPFTLPGDEAGRALRMVREAMRRRRRQRLEGASASRL